MKVYDLSLHLDHRRDLFLLDPSDHRPLQVPDLSHCSPTASCSGLFVRRSEHRGQRIIAEGICEPPHWG